MTHTQENHLIMAAETTLALRKEAMDRR